MAQVIDLTKELNLRAEKRLEKIKEIMENKKTIYNLKVDQKENRFGNQNKLQKVDSNKLPLYIQNNLDKFENWIEK